MQFIFPTWTKQKVDLRYSQERREQDVFNNRDNNAGHIGQRLNQVQYKWSVFGLVQMVQRQCQCDEGNQGEYCK